ncbi:uncharacterized protein LOC128963935 [Oppia nitens]|uniref:uncharacterized protein LOC128963935 n=1 Tax=Oppia nitens TaxID=1686743 RepID=UPI0023DAB972|nr:uncharacterized protein LOC128963935 [Oppia nitens]
MADFANYKVISNKLKKRFLLRRPNVSEVSEQFLSLSRDLNQFKAYSGYCCLAVARCEHSMGNTAAETQALLDSARLLRDGDQLNGAISAYRHALRVSHKSLHTSIYGELATLYKRHQKYLEASNVYIEANLLKEAIDCFLSCSQWERALETFSRVDSSVMTESDFVTLFLLKLYLNDTNKCEFNLPIVECNPQNDELMDLNIMLESLLIWSQTRSEDIVDSIAAHLFPKLNGHQNQLLYLILTEKDD